jgi:choline dehydrogenase-like flavoprotein
LADSGLEVLLVERGRFLPREPENSQPDQMFIHHRYKTAEPWIDGSTGRPFQPGNYYWVGGNTKMYGACLPRFRASDFTEVQHHDGLSPAWPITYEELEPYYGQAEKLFQVHGRLGEDPTEPPHSTDFPNIALEHEPVIERFAARLRDQGLHPFHMANGMNLDTMEQRRAATTADGSPCESDVKSDAENRAIRPALQRENVRILIETEVCRLETDPSGRRVVAAIGRGPHGAVRIEGKQFSVSGGAVNSSVLLLNSANEHHPDGLGNSSGLLGRNYMVHNSTFFIAINPVRHNPTAWQKTLGINDWYEAGPDSPYPLGNVQMLGKLQGAHFKGARSWAPMWALNMVGRRSLDLYLTTEDLPRPGNRVKVVSGKITIDWTPNNLAPHAELVRRLTRAARRAGYPIVLTERMGIQTNSHQCGTAVAGSDPARSVLTPECRSHDVENLWVVDSSFFPSSAAVNPALTIAANALRVAPLISGAGRR